MVSLVHCTLLLFRMKLGNNIRMIPDSMGGVDHLDGILYGAEFANIFLLILVSSDSKLLMLGLSS